MESQRLTPGQERLLEQLIAKLTKWDNLLGLGKPGARQLRGIIRAEIETYKDQLIRGRA